MLSTVKNGKRVWERGVFEGGLSRADLMSEWGWGGEDYRAIQADCREWRVE